MVNRLGIGSSYGVGADAIERAYYEKGVNYLYWGSLRRKGFGVGISRLARKHREDLVVVVESYTRLAGLMASSLQRALRALKLDYADVLLLGMHNKPPSARVKEAAQKLRESGQARFLAVSCHRRGSFRIYRDEGFFDVCMFRYSAAHRGAETEVLPLFDARARPGTVAYTATRWGQLLDPRRLSPAEKTPSASDCYRFVLSHPNVDVCLTGPANDAQIRQALTALELGPMTSEELDWMRRVGDYLHNSPTARTFKMRLFQAD